MENQLELNFLKLVLKNIYTRKLTNAFLKENNESVHKEIAELKGIRYAYMEEYPKNCNLNVDLYKDLVDGNALTNKVMYGTTENEIVMIFKQICNDDDKMFDFMMSFLSYILFNRGNKRV